MVKNNKSSGRPLGRTSGWKDLPPVVAGAPAKPKKVKESDIQRAVVKYCRENNIKVMASASGIYCSGMNGGLISIFKSLGIIQDKGYPDLFMPYPRRDDYSNIISCGLFIELKTESGVVSEEQHKMLEDLRESGYDAVVCRGLDDALYVIKDYFNLL